MSAEKRGSIAFCSTYRSSVPLDIFSVPVPPASKQDEVPLTDGESYNYNGQVIPADALKAILKRPKLASQGLTDADVDAGRVSGIVCVSERGNLETLHIALLFGGISVVFSLTEVFGTFGGVRMEDSGCVAGDYLVYVTTKDPAFERRQPWTAVYKTNLTTGKTDRLTPSLQADLSPSVSPSGKKIAVASFQRKAGWDGEIEDLKTVIFVMNVDRPFNRRLVVRNGGWPTWGSDDVIFFHRKVGEFWGVFRAEIGGDGATPAATNSARVTPDGIDAVTPAAIDATTVAVATIRKKSKFGDRREEVHYRHIEIFDSAGRRPPTRLTQKTEPNADHFSPFVIDGGKRIGYHRCKSDRLKVEGDVQEHFDRIESPQPDVGLFRVSGVFPTFSKDGSKLAFVDSEFRNIWLADGEGLRCVYETEGADSIFSPVWNQDPEKDILYACRGPSFSAAEELHIIAIPQVSRGKMHSCRLTKKHNNAFPSTNPDGTKLVFRSTRDGGAKKHKNLYIMEDALAGEYMNGKVTRLTNGEWTDTHCHWSPRGDWIVFSSTRDKPGCAPATDHGLDPGYFAVFLVRPDDPSVVVRVVGSGVDLTGHVNHPFFSPDGRSVAVAADLVAVAADLAGVSADPISLLHTEHSVRPYGDIFTVDVDEEGVKRRRFERVTHSRYENSTGTWTAFSTRDPNAAWNLLLNRHYSNPSCPSLMLRGAGTEGWRVSGHICIPKTKYH